jgi:hypothetical protein
VMDYSIQANLWHTVRPEIMKLRFLKMRFVHGLGV